MTSAESRGAVTLLPDNGTLLVLGGGVEHHRSAFLFFRAGLGAERVDSGWRVPLRRVALTLLVLRIHDWLQASGYRVVAEGLADAAIERELARRRSFRRTAEAARDLKAGTHEFDFTRVEAALGEFGWSNERQLKSHQIDGVAHALTAINAANFSVPGSGKTVTTLATAIAHLQSRTVDLLITVGPLSSFEPWEQEARAAIGNGLRVRRVRGNAASRRAYYEQAERCDVLLLSYATAAADQSLLLDLCGRFAVMLVVDESHRIKRFRGGVWAPALMEVARHASVRAILSGTPMPQSGRDLFSQLNVLWPDGLLTGTRDAFANQVENQFETVLTRVDPFVSRAPKEALGLPPYRVVTHEIPMVGTQLQVYELISNRFRQRLVDADTWRDKLNTLKRGRPIRLLQAACNPGLFNSSDRYFELPRLADGPGTLLERLAAYGETEIPAKSEAAIEVVRDLVDAGQKVVVWSNFVANLDHFRRLVIERIGVPCFQIDGRVPAGTEGLRQDPGEMREEAGLDTREEIIHRFLSIDGPSLLITNPASCSESISLHSACRNAIYLDRTYDCALYLQSIDRIHRLGLPADADVSIHVFLATARGAPTIDHLVQLSLESKDARMRALLEGTSLAPLALSETPADDAEGALEDLESLLRFLLGEMA